MNISDKDKIKKVVIAAGAVVVKDDPDSGEPMILLIKRHHNDHWPMHWEFPRGKCNRSETVKQCLKREVKEETGLDVNIVRPIDRFDYLADRGERLTKCYNFLCRLVNDNQKVKLSKEHEDYHWLDSLGQGELLLMPEQKKTIAKVLDRDERIINYPDNDFTKNNTMNESKNKPTNPGLWNRAKAAAKKKFDVYPSAYANAWASKWYKDRGGKWKTVSETYEKSGLGKWFKEKWVDVSRKDKDGNYMPCGRKDADKGKYPKCRPLSSALKMSKKEKLSAIRRKRSAEKKDTQKGKGQKPVMVKTKVGENKMYLQEILDHIQESKHGNKPLRKPFRLPAGSKKKFGVYVKNDKGNVVLVKFGDPNMEIKRDDPDRRRSFRARHRCDNPGPEWKARYWSCRMWEKGKSVSDYTRG